MRMKALFCFIVSGLLAVSVMAQSTARQWNQDVVGWNLGNQLECPPSGQDASSTDVGNPDNAMQAETAWGNPVVTQATIDAVKAAGFNAVRIPVRWQWHITNATDMTVDAQWMQRVKEVVDYCLSQDLKVIVNTHHDMWLESRPTYQYRDENLQRLWNLWTQIANTFKDYDYRVAFAGTNEVHMPNNFSAPTEENLAVQNSYNQVFVNAVRATEGNNAKRHLIVQTYNCNADFGLYGGFKVPNDIESNGLDYMSVEVHYYNPWEYCGSATYYYWGLPYQQYGSTPSANEQNLALDFQNYADTWGSKGLGIIIGEWGVTDHWDNTAHQERIHENMAYYCKTLVSEARQRGLATFVWDNGTFGNGTEKYGIFDHKDNMKVKATWVMDGIHEGMGTDIRMVQSDIDNHASRTRAVLYKGGILIFKDGHWYNLHGQRLYNDSWWY